MRDYATVNIGSDRLDSDTFPFYEEPQIGGRFLSFGGTVFGGVYIRQANALGGSIESITIGHGCDVG